MHQLCLSFRFLCTYVQGLTCDQLFPYSTCAGKTGFSGLKGCIGAEFLTRGSPPSNLTREECENMQLGMTDEERSAFLERGSALWCGCSSPSSSTFCMDGIPVRTLLLCAGVNFGYHSYNDCAKKHHKCLTSLICLGTDTSCT